MFKRIQRNPKEPFVMYAPFVSDLLSASKRPIIIGYEKPVSKRGWVLHFGKVFFAGAVVFSVVLALVWTIAKRYKNKKRNWRETSRLDFIDDVSKAVHTNVDFAHASLDELEGALLQVENELDYLVSQTEKNKK